MEHQDSDLRLKKTDIIFVLSFILGLAVLSFVFGVRIGKKTALNSLGDIGQMQISEKKFLNQAQEMNQVEDERAALDERKPVSQPVEVEVVSLEPKTKTKSTAKTVKAMKNLAVEPSQQQVVETTTIPYINSGDTEYTRKNTILVGEFLSLEQAQLFAQGFKLRGYDVYIQKFPQSGIEKLRVSLGRFQDKSSAKNFMKTNSNMFLKNKYKITSFL